VRKEAYAKGMQEGFAVGMAKAREAAHEDKQSFLKLTTAFSEALEKSDEQIADDVLSLALDIAKSMLKVKLNVDPAAVLPVVMDAIHYLPYVQKPARILVHHDDAQMLREYLADEISSQNWQILEDSSVERGGCLVETGANQIDATNEMRWKRISEALAQNNNWLMP
jgi:flagellar assembly protein FliH